MVGCSTPPPQTAWPRLEGLGVKRHKLNSTLPDTGTRRIRKGQLGLNYGLSPQGQPLSKSLVPSKGGAFLSKNPTFQRVHHYRGAVSLDGLRRGPLLAGWQVFRPRNTRMVTGFQFDKSPLASAQVGEIPLRISTDVPVCDRSQWNPASGAIFISM